jgi:hypothetical protein
MTQQTNDTLDMNALPFWQWQYTSPSNEVLNTGIPFDSIHPVHNMPDTVFRESIIAPHNLPLKHNGMENRLGGTMPAWIFIALLFFSTLICLLFHLRNIKLGHLLKSAIDFRAMDRLVRDCNLKHIITMLPMGLLLVAELCLVVHQEQLPESGIPGYLALFAAVALFYILRNGLLRLLGNTFDNKQGVALYITSNYLYHLIESTVVVAILFLYFYLPEERMAMTWILIIFLCLAFLTRFLRSIKIFLTHPKSSCFYLFYYLCIVEITPILVVLKWYFVQ